MAKKVATKVAEVCKTKDTLRGLFCMEKLARCGTGCAIGCLLRGSVAVETSNWVNLRFCMHAIRTPPESQALVAINTHLLTSVAIVVHLRALLASVAELS